MNYWSNITKEGFNFKNNWCDRIAYFVKSWVQECSEFELQIKESDQTLLNRILDFFKHDAKITDQLKEIINSKKVNLNNFSILS